MSSLQIEGTSERQEILELLGKARACAVDESRGSFANALRSLHSALVALRSPPGASLEGREESGETAQFPQPATDASRSLPRSGVTEQEFLQTVADKLINLERVVFSIDEEINGEEDVDALDYETDFDWYNDAVDMIDRGAGGNSVSREGTELLESTDDISPECTDPERWIDRCLDACGYANSLEAAADCLRRIARDPSAPPAIALLPSTSSESIGESRRPGLVAAVASLRTIRRRLVLSSSSNVNQRGILPSVPEPYQGDLISLATALSPELICRLWECIVLPLEYHKQPNNQLLSESLPSLAMSLILTLVSSACHTIDLPLPMWAAPKASSGLLIHSAWKMVLAGDLLCRSTASLSGKDVSLAASDHFQLLIRTMIETGRSEVVARYLYQCWASARGDAKGQGACTPRSLLKRQLQLVLASIPSKRGAAVFCQEILRRCAKQCLRKSEETSFSGRQAREQLDRLFSDNDSFIDILLPSLAKGSELAEAAVNYIVLTPPASFHRQRNSSSASPSLRAVDWAIPRSLSRLLALACADDHDVQSDDAAEPEQSDSEDSLENSRPAAERGGFLAHLFTVASVWCKDVFVTRTDPLQQQYVTEFLLEPLESRQLTQTDLQAGITDDGSQLATTLVQGVTLRLDVSRSESVRMDGMRVAEAMASLLGQQLRFDELHPPGDGDASNEKDAEKTKKEQTAKSKKRTGKKRRERLKPRVPVVVDPDAEYFTDDSDSSDDSSQSDSSTDESDESDESSDSNSSWGEDSLEPYRMDDDEEDLRRVPRPYTLRDCLAYFLTAENDDLAYDKHEAALVELATIVASEPLDLLDVVSTLVRILLFLEDKFSLPQFLEKRWGCLMAFGVHAPVETCVVLVQEIRGNISLGTRLDALAVLSSVAQELSGMAGQRERALPNSSSQEVVSCSTKLRRARDLQESKRTGIHRDVSTQSTKTRRWRRSRTPRATSANRFGPVSVQMIYSLFGLLSDTRSDETIWGDAIGEKFLSEFLKTLSTMLHCARNYPSSSLPVIAGDLFDLAWSFHDAKCPDVRYAALMAFATCVPIEPALVLRVSALGPYLKRCSENDENADCRNLASLVEGSISEALSQS